MPIPPKYPRPDAVRAVVEAYGKVEALVDVAVKKLAVGEEVAMTAPLAFVERMELIAVPEIVSEGDEIELAAMVPVAVILATLVILPEMSALPWTPSVPAGVVEPIPVFPAKKFVADEDEAYIEFVVIVEVATSAVPAAFETTNEELANDVALVPPFDTGRTPEIVVRVVVACHVGTPFTRART